MSGSPAQAIGDRPFWRVHCKSPCRLPLTLRRVVHLKVFKHLVKFCEYIYEMAYKLTVIQEQTPGLYAWQIVDSSRPGWVKRSLLSFRSSGLASAAGIAEIKCLSRQRSGQPARAETGVSRMPFWAAVLQNFQSARPARTIGNWQ